MYSGGRAEVCNYRVIVGCKLDGIEICIAARMGWTVLYNLANVFELILPFSFCSAGSRFTFTSGLPYFARTGMILAMNLYTFPFLR